MSVCAAGLAVLVVLTGACAPTSTRPAGSPPDEPPYIEGSLTQLTASAEGGTILVEEPEEGGNQAAVEIGADTVVVQEFGGGYEPSNFNQLRPGQVVAVWTTGPVRESFPVQIDASGVVIREAGGR